MLTDEELGAVLRHRLAESVAEVHAAPGLAATVSRRYTRRTLATRAGIALPVAAALAVTVAVAPGAIDRHAPPAAHTAPATVPMLDAAYISAHTTAALAKASDDVLRTSTASPTGRDISWQDQRTDQLRFDHFDQQGRRTFTTGEAIAPDGYQTSIVLDYTDRAWWTERFKPRNVPPGTLQIAPYQNPQDILAALRTGTLRLIGHERVDGHDTLHLVLTDIPKNVPASFDIWVDAQTYLPVRLLVNKVGHLITVNYQWLPRTAANVAALTVTPPAGFTHRSGPPPSKPRG